MAVIQDATPTPTKADLLAAWMRVPGAQEAANRPALTGTWLGRDEPAVLALVEEPG